MIPLLALLLAACGDKSLDDALINYRLDIVTFAGNDQAGNVVFDYYGQGDSVPVRLVSTWRHDIGARPGRRLLLRYGTDTKTLPAGSVAVKAYGVSAIVSDTLRVASAPIGNNDPVRLRSLWRTGPYMNVRCLVEHTGEPQRFALLADGQTIGNDTVVCRLVHSLEGHLPQQWQEIYASFLIGDDTVGATCRVLRVIVDCDVVRPERTTYDFNIHTAHSADK